MSGPYLANLQKPTLHRSLSCHKPWEVRSDGQSSACNHNFFMSPKAAKKSESSPITNKTLCVSCWDKQLTDLSAEKITKMILEGTFFPENIQCNILAKPWKIKFWCGNCISSHTRNAFGKQFKLIHGQKTNKHFFWSCWMTWSEPWTRERCFYMHSLLGWLSLKSVRPRYFCPTSETQGGQMGELRQQWFIYPVCHKESC